MMRGNKNWCERLAKSLTKIEFIIQKKIPNIILKMDIFVDVTDVMGRRIFIRIK